MTVKRKNNSIQALCFIGLFFIFYLITYTDILSITVFNATPMPLIALTVIVGYYYGEWMGFISGILCGVFLDAVMSHSVCFNTVFLLIIGCAAGFLVRYLLNRNIFSVIMITFISCALYFAFKFIFCMELDSGETYRYLLLYALPSAVYSTAFVIPFYYLGGLIKKI